MSNMAKVWTSVLSAAVLGWLSTVAALDASASDPRAIMQAAVDQLNTDSAISRMKMTIRQGASTRERLMTVRRRRFGEDRKVMILIESPADVRNTGFLTVDYKDQARSDEQWLYLPGLHRVSRVPNSGKADSFVGSDFSISDLSGQEPADFQLKLLAQSTKVGDEECWLLESLPRDDQVKAKTGYTKAQLWISKQKLLVVQFKAWAIDPKITKYFKAMDIRQVDGLWTPHRLQMRTLEEGGTPSETLVDVLSVKNRAPEVSDADFTEQRLARGI